MIRIDSYVTGSQGFVGKHLMKKLKGMTVPIKQKQMPYDDCEHLFFLSTYGNMASHTDHTEMIRANVVDPLMWIQSELVKGLFVFMSSSSVTLPVQTPYSMTKRAAELILLSLPELPSAIVRPYSITGVGEQKEHLIPTLIRSCMEGAPMDFDASPVHDFVDVTEVADALISLAGDKATGIFELGSGIPHTNQQVRELVEGVCGKKANIQSSVRMRAYDNEQWYCRNPTPYLHHRKPLKQSIYEMVTEYKISNCIN